MGMMARVNRGERNWAAGVRLGRNARLSQQKREAEANAADDTSSSYDGSSSEDDDQ
jgi:hypothetical protein